MRQREAAHIERTVVCTRLPGLDGAVGKVRAASERYGGGNRAASHQSDEVAARAVVRAVLTRSMRREHVILGRRDVKDATTED